MPETTWTENKDGAFTTDGATITMKGRKPRRWRFDVKTDTITATGNTVKLTDAQTACERLLAIGGEEES
jgi:hypothetical protein